jgi:YLP motif-containing protein 1
MKLLNSGSHPSEDKSTKGINPPPPRYQTVLIEDILNQPGRLKRPPQIVVILRGLPGSGKSYIAKLIKVILSIMYT